MAVKINVLAYLCVLLQQTGEVVEERVLGAQEVKLVVSLLPIHQVSQELPPVPGHKLGRQFHYVSGKYTQTKIEMTRKRANCCQASTKP